MLVPHTKVVLKATDKGPNIILTLAMYTTHRINVHREDNTVKTRVLIISLLATLMTVALTGCSNHDGNEWERLVCAVESVNGGAPLLSAYAEIGNDNIAGTADDVFTVDWVPVVFRARPYSSSIVLPEDGVQSWFQITSYDLTWEPLGAAPAGLTDHNIVGGLVDVRVPVYEDAVGSVLIADRVLKEEPWFLQLINTPGYSFTANCHLTFYGHESGNTREVTIDGGFMVTFYGYVSDN